MEPRLAMTVFGIGDDGNRYTIHGYKQMRRQGSEWVEEELVSIVRTAEGEELHCESEVPLVFWNPMTGIKIRCEK